MSTSENQSALSGLQQFQLHFTIHMADGTVANGHTDVPHLENIIMDLLKQQHPSVHFKADGRFVEFRQIVTVEGASIVTEDNFVLANDPEYSQKLNLRLRRAVMESEEKWMERAKQIPFIKFPADWEVMMFPPFSNALVRFRVRLPNGDEKSVYLDDQSALGYFDLKGSAYWEVYPYQNDVGRCGVNEIDKLLRMIGGEDVE